MGRTMIRFLFLLLGTSQLRSDAAPQPKPLEGVHLTVVLEHVSLLFFRIWLFIKYYYGDGRIRNKLQFPPVTMIERNSSGHVIGYSGSRIEQFDWLSRCLGFEYNNLMMLSFILAVSLRVQLILHPCRYTLMPWDNSTLGPIKSNTTRNAFGEMIGQLIRKVICLLIFFMYHRTCLLTLFCFYNKRK